MNIYYIGFCCIIILLFIMVKWGDRSPEDRAEKDSLLPLRETRDPEKVPLGALVWITRLGYCEKCEGEFPIPEEVPDACPYCGADFHPGAGIPMEEESRESFSCPSCGGRFEMLDGDIPEFCPYCGEEIDDVDEEGSYMRDSYHVCAECGQEFRVKEGTNPVRCPNCGARFIEE